MSCRISGIATRWSWELDGDAPGDPARSAPAPPTRTHADLGERWWYVARLGRPASRPPVHRERHELRAARQRRPIPSPYVKDGINDAVVNGKGDRGRTTSRAASSPATSHAVVAPGGSFSVEVRFCAEPRRQSVRRFRRHLRQPHRRGRRLLRRRSHPPTLGADERLVAAPGLRRAALVQAVLSLRRLPLAHGRSRRNRRRPRQRWHGRNCALEGAAQRRRDPDARHLGVSLVRLVGPGLSLCGDGPHRSRVRQGAAAADGLRVVSARQRPVPGLRMELRRRESAGHSAGRRGASTRSTATRPGDGRHRVPQGDVPERDAELQLLGQPQGQRAAATSSAAASWAWTTSACSTATSRCPTAASSSRATARAGWRCYCITMLTIADRARPARLRLPEHGDQVLRALPLHRPRHDQHRTAPGINLWDERGPVLLRRDPPPVGREHPAARSTRWSAWCRCSPCSSSRPTETARARSCSSTARNGSSSIGPTCSRTSPPCSRRARTTRV